MRGRGGGLFQSRRTPWLNLTIWHGRPPMKQIRRAAVRECHHDVSGIRRYSVASGLCRGWVMPCCDPLACSPLPSSVRWSSQRPPQQPLRSECLAMANAPPRAMPVSLRRVAAKAEERRDHLCRAFHLLHRHARRRADRDRFQRRLPDRAAARRRHHEPRALDPLHVVSRSENSARPARLGRERTAGACLDARRRRLYPQRPHRHPPLLWRGFRRRR